MDDKPISWILANTSGVDDAGAEAIWNAFFPKLRRVIERKLRDIPQRTFDSDDIAQNAMHSLFKGLQAKRFEGVTNRDELWRLLVVITARKITAQQRNTLAKKRGGNLVRGESVFVGGSEESDDFSYGINQIMDENRMPESATEVLKTYEQMLQGIRDAASVETVMLRMEGYTNAEIADKLGCSVSRVEQRIAKVRRIWQSELDAKESEKQ